MKTYSIFVLFFLCTQLHAAAEPTKKLETIAQKIGAGEYSGTLFSIEHTLELLKKNPDLCENKTVEKQICTMEDYLQKNGEETLRQLKNVLENLENPFTSGLHLNEKKFITDIMQPVRDLTAKSKKISDLCLLCKELLTLP